MIKHTYKQIMITLMLVCLLSGVGNAAMTTYCWYDGDREGVYQKSYSSGAWSGVYYMGSTNDLYVKWYINCPIGGNWKLYSLTTNTQCWVGAQTVRASGSNNGEGIYHISGVSNGGVMLRNWDTQHAITVKYIVSNTSLTEYTVSGNISCVDKVELHIKDPNTGYFYEIADNTSGDTYSFDVLDGYTYSLYWKPGAAYTTFTVNGSNVVIDYDACSHTQYRFEESCGNLIPDSEGLYIENCGVTVLAIEDFYAPNGILDISDSSSDHIYVYTNSFIGSTGWIIDPVVSNSTYTLENPNIAWGLKVIVQNESDGSLIDDAIVLVNQSCYCTAGTSVRQKKTVQGMVEFGDMSLQDASLFVKKTGYKILNENTTGYDVFLSGRSNFSSKTWVVKLANSSSNNSSSFYEVNETTNLYFRDVNNNITSKILDTDANVYLHYNNNNSNNEPMTLKFQSSSTHTYFIDEQSWNIPHGEIGYKTITNSYFTPWDYSYRAVMYNNSIYGWNITMPLTVRNGTRETDQHYQNLTTNLFFMHTTAGKIDYRDDMSIGIHARSNNTTLMNLDIELWKDGVYIACKNLTETILANTDYPYYYIWNPVFDYVSGSNYSVRMYGFDRTLLETDYVDCITDNTTRKNKLTIVVKDYWGVNVDDTTVYLEGYGSIPTGTNYYASFEGLDNGYYRFKATKDGYVWAGWNNTTLSDADQTITYTLTEGTTENLYTVTINIFNATDVPLTNSTVYLSGKDPIDTSVNNYGIFYNVTEGTHTYKAGKSGYSTSTLTDINVNSNKNININLNIGTPVIINYTAERLTDTEVQDIYLPIMYLIFICILVGAFFAIAGGKF